MAKDKRDRLGCWTIVIVFCLMISVFLLIVEITGGLSVGKFELVSAIVFVIILVLLRRSSKALKRGAGIELLEDYHYDGGRLLNASDFEVGTFWSGTLYLSLTAKAETNGKMQWFIRLRTIGGNIGEIRDGAELIFKNADGELIEIYNDPVGWNAITKDIGFWGDLYERKGVYPINLEILDALCIEDIVKIRLINELRPLDVNVKGQNLANLFRISRNVIEKALDPENTIYSGM